MSVRTVRAADGCYNASSCPTNASAPDMQYLSSHQALQDLAAFHDYAIKMFGISEKAPWILIGGSCDRLATEPRLGAAMEGRAE